MGFSEVAGTWGFDVFLQEWHFKAKLIGKTGLGTETHRNDSSWYQGENNASDTIFPETRGFGKSEEFHVSR